MMSKAGRELKKSGYEFKYQSSWGKRWSRLYISYRANQMRLDDKILDDILKLLKELVIVSKPMFDKINWGRLKRQKEQG